MNDPLPLVVANLKANKTWQEIVGWLDLVGPKALDFPGTIVVCPSLPFIGSAHAKIQSANWRIKLAVQNISQFDQGPYTGEVAATQVKNLCDYAIVGHSERRQNFTESDNIVAQKFQKAKEAGLTAIFCATGPGIAIPAGVRVVAYEPIFAIGTGNTDTPENAASVAQKLKAKGEFIVIYGGSVTGENVASFLKKGTVDGVLVGTASLDPATFIDIIESATY
ncbi:MAG: triose-phosphate isomerase family protein [Patescibacteria group bacterium]|mgnify:CR=1 FL=1